MTHVGFIVAAYGIAVGIPGIFAIGAASRLAAVRRRLAAIDPRTVP